MAPIGGLMLGTALLVALLTSVWSQGYNNCPNDCNGHGMCSMGDVMQCICHEPYDNEAPDCSRSALWRAPCPRSRAAADILPLCVFCMR